MIEICRKFRFEAAHWLPRVPSGHKCGSLHGHSYEVEVILRGAVDPQQGWLVDFADIDLAVSPVVRILDHSCLNDIDGLENPTSELLAAWLFARVTSALPQLAAIRVSETAGSYALYAREWGSA